MPNICCLRRNLIYALMNQVKKNNRFDVDNEHIAINFSPAFHPIEPKTQSKLINGDIFGTESMNILKFYIYFY